MPNINKVIYGNQTLLDISDSTTTANNLLRGAIGYAGSGERVIGTLEPGGQSNREYIGQLIPRVANSSLKITDSGHDEGFDPWYAFDGIDSADLRSPTHCWSATQNDDNAWIQYEFDRVYYFTKLVIKCFSNYSDDWVGDIKVLGSEDGITWENILTEGSNIEITAPFQEFGSIEITLNQTNTYQYIRIQADNNAFTIYYEPSIFFDEIYVYGGVEVNGLNVNILKGADTPSNTMGLDGQIYLTVGPDARYQYDETLNGYILKSYYVYAGGTELCNVAGRVYVKSGDGAAIGVTWKHPSFSGPILISTVAANVLYSWNEAGPLGSAVVDGVTWYVSGNGFWSNPVSSSKMPIFEASYLVDQSNLETVVRDILNACNFSTTLSGTSINNVYLKIDGVWKEIVGEEIENVLPDKLLTYIIAKNAEPDANEGYDGQIFLKNGLKGALLHFDESITADETGGGNAWVAQGTPSPVLSTSQAKFGGKSAYFTDGAYLQTNGYEVNSYMGKFGSNDFTIACWIYPTSTDRQTIFAANHDCRLAVDIFYNGDSANMWFSSNGVWNEIQSDTGGVSNSGIGTISINANEWTHFAMTRQGDKCRTFINGQLSKETTLSSANVELYYDNDKFRIGVWGNDGYPFRGYMDEFLIVNGIALWTESFTPPTEAYDIEKDFKFILNAYAKVNGVWQNLLLDTKTNEIVNAEPYPTLQFKKYAYFPGSNVSSSAYLLLPFKPVDDGSTRKYEISWYDIPGKGNTDNYIISDSNSDCLFIRHRYGYYSFTADNATNVAFASGDHTMIFNENNKVLFDGNEVGDFHSTMYPNRNIHLASKNTGYLEQCYIKEVKVTDTTTGDLLFHLKPALFNGVGCMYDIINKKIYYMGEANNSPTLQVMDTIPTT